MCIVKSIKGDNFIILNFNGLLTSAFRLKINKMTAAFNGRGHFVF